MKLYQPEEDPTEAVVRINSIKRCSSKFRQIHRKTPVPERFFNKVAAKISPNSQEDTCATEFFLKKLQASGLQLYQ